MKTLPLLFALALAASPDVVPEPPPGMRRVVREITVRLADPDGAWILGHRIALGDTFEKLAGSLLRDPGATAWLVGLNADSDPRRLGLGQLVWMPRAAALAARAGWLCGAEVGRPGFPDARILEFADGRERVGSLVLCRSEQAAAFHAVRAADDPAGWRAMEEAGQLLVLRPPGVPDAFVPTDSGVERIAVDATLRLGADGRPELRTDAVRFLDAAGAEIAWPPPALSPGAGALLVVLAGVGTVVLVAFAISRWSRAP
jgi:hypothetical protein